MPQVPIALWAVGVLTITVLSAIPLIVSFLSWRVDGHWGDAHERHDATALARDGPSSSVTYALVWALTFAVILAVIHVYLSLRPEAGVSLVGSITAANVDEDLDRIVSSRSLQPRRANQSASPTPADSSQSNPLLGQACASERSALDHLRQQPSAEAARLFWHNLQCEGLRPQVRLLLESLNVAPHSVGSAVAPSEPEARGGRSHARS
jgi:hypothetical protein